MLLLVLLAVLPALGVVLYDGLQHREGDGLDARQEALQVARSPADQQRRVIDSTEQILKALSSVPAVRDLDTEACTELMATLVADNTALDNLGVIAPDGEAKCSGLPMPGPVNLADQAYFQRAVATRDFALGDYQVGQITQRPVLGAAYPMIDGDGTIRGVVVAAIDLASLNATLAEADLPAGSVLTVADGAGTILARQPDPEAWLGEAFPEAPIIRAVVHSGEGTIETTGIDGVLRLYGFTRLEGGAPTAASEAFVAVGIPSAIVFGEAEEALRRNLAVLGLVAMLALIAAWFGGGSLLVHPIRSLIAATERVATGDLTARVEMVDRGGEIGQLAGAFNAMTESLAATLAVRRAAEAALADSESRIKAVFDASNNVLLLVDERGRIVLANGQVEAMFGYPPAELLGASIERLMPDEDAELHAGQRGRYLEAPVARQMGRGLDLAGRRADGSVFPVEIALSPISRPEGIHVLATVVDLTERQALEVQLRQAQRMESVGRLAGGVAHDFNNLLTAIRGYAELLLRALPTEDAAQRADVEQIMAGTDRAAELTQQLLAFGRRQVLAPRVVDPAEIVAGIVPMLRRLVSEHIEIVNHATVGQDWVRIDPAQFEQVLVNLAINAGDAMPDGGRLTFEIAPVHLDAGYAATHPEVSPGPFVMLAVSDTGGGMDPSTLAQVFEPFFTTKPAVEGRGLGLSTVHGIVTQSGGSIFVYSEPGQGSTFKIYLPRLTESGAIGEVSPPPAQAGPLTGTETILLVEDEAPVREVTRRMLEGSGYTVLLAASGEEALVVTAAHPGPIELLLTDVVLTGLNGAALAERLIERRPGLRVLFMSGYTESTIVRNGVLVAGETYLPKPFSAEALGRAVRAVLEGRSWNA